MIVFVKWTLSEHVESNIEGRIRFSLNSAFQIQIFHAGIG